MKKILLIAAALALTACGPRLSGTYTDAAGLMSFTFKSGDKVAMTTMGIETELDYKIEDKQVKIGNEKGAMVLTLLDDGSMQGPMGVKLTKREQ